MVSGRVLKVLKVWVVLIRKGTTIETEVSYIVETAMTHGPLEDALVFVTSWWLQRCECIPYHNRQDLKQILLVPVIKNLIEAYGVETAREYIQDCVNLEKG